MAVAKDPSKKPCEPLSAMGAIAPFCPFNDEQKKDSCPLAKAARREISVKEGITSFYEKLTV